MTDYTNLIDKVNVPELVKALRLCARGNCRECGRYDIECEDNLHRDAAAVIEELDAEETRLLLITSELQDKVMDLQEQLNDADVAVDDDRRQIEELEAEVKDAFNRGYNAGYVAGVESCTSKLKKELDMAKMEVQE